MHSMKPRLQLYVQLDNTQFTQHDKAPPSKPHSTYTVCTL
jgi:hypothetical protein